MDPDTASNDAPHNGTVSISNAGNAPRSFNAKRARTSSGASSGANAASRASRASRGDRNDSIHPIQRVDRETLSTMPRNQLLNLATDILPSFSDTELVSVLDVLFGLKQMASSLSPGNAATATNSTANHATGNTSHATRNTSKSRYSFDTLPPNAADTTDNTEGLDGIELVQGVEGMDDTDIWDFWFSQLQEYKEQHGDLDVPPHYEDNPNLSTWVDEQRRQYRKKELSHERFQQLSDLGFSFARRNSRTTSAIAGMKAADLWGMRYQQLLDYKAAHGNCDVPYTYPINQPLANWVNRQRTRNNKKRIKAEHYELLDSIGFMWTPSKVWWETRFEELKAFKETHGHFEIPMDQPSLEPLLRWTTDQRKKARWLPIDKMHKLYSIGFDFDPPGVSWEKRFQQLNKYKREHGTCDVPAGCDRKNHLASWVLLQCKLHRAKILALDRFEKLHDLGFFEEVFDGNEEEGEGGVVGEA